MQTAFWSRRRVLGALAAATAAAAVPPVLIPAKAAAATTASDDDIVLGEGRQIVFVAPEAVSGLPLTTAAARILPAFLASDRYQELVS